jgi:4-hydroxybenzoate polyprenyltransferase
VPYLLLLFVFLETFISQIALDMKDEKADRAIKLMTLPALLGGDRAQNVVLVMSFTVAIAVTATALLLSAPYQVALLAVATLAFNVMMTRLVKNGKDIAFIAVAGKYLLWPALVLILP